MNLTPDDVANAKTIFFVRKTDVNYGNQKFEVNDPRPPQWRHKGKTTITMDIMNMASVPRFTTYQGIIRFATQNTDTVSGTHFVINAANIDDAIREFTLYANQNPSFFKDVQVSEITNKMHEMQQMRQMQGGTRKRKSKFSSKKLRHKSNRKNQKRKCSRKMI